MTMWIFFLVWVDVGTSNEDVLVSGKLQWKCFFLGFFFFSIFFITEEELIHKRV